MFIKELFISISNMKRAQVDDNDPDGKPKKLRQVKTKYECICCYNRASVEFSYCDACRYRACLNCIFDWAYVNGNCKNGLNDVNIKCFFCRKPIEMKKGMLTRILSRRKDFFRVLKNETGTGEFVLYKNSVNNEIGISKVIEKEKKSGEWVQFNNTQPPRMLQRIDLILPNTIDIFGSNLNIPQQPPPPPPSTAPNEDEIEPMENVAANNNYPSLQQIIDAMLSLENAQ